MNRSFEVMTCILLSQDADQVKVTSSGHHITAVQHIMVKFKRLLSVFKTLQDG